ncbi:SusC/RagA family TonB-linked outer membrane protein [Segetibacter sp. 3557_3]|uniref:SusC/RagA family TonB-linked outer membrane protein n=1 Tax=Segetibacter sp. 3557_3 TaxID=2547429 RepID=UPI0010589249|nr:SusC/RagA family TonB-linked outer membrane protein [Segetibacter sp. 3557_3]TDH24153.1 SusC/RagA family TonB-linked outer membrane protein [Segetibacter sp. 3557_3]
MRNFTSTITVLLCIIFPLFSFSQQRTISGKVSNKDGVGIPNVTVAPKGTTSGGQTSTDGTFQIGVGPAVNTLLFSSVGYETLEVDVTGKTSIDVILTVTNVSLNEVVVIGYGSVRKKDATGSVASVKAKDFNQGVIVAPDQLLQGKVAGLDITNNSGQPGAATTIKIRGNNSIRANNNPLYVVDGVPLDGRTARPSLNFSVGGFGPTPESNPLLYINPNDIAQIDVLKDASATAIYGSRGANGIIVITTKRGATSGTKLEFGINMGVFAGYMKKYKVLDAAEFRGALKKYTLDTFQVSLDKGGSVDALKEITSNDLTQNYNLAVSGGNESGKFRASFLGSRTAGFIKKSSLDKYLGNFSGQYKFLDKRLSFDFSLIAGHTTENMALISNTPGAGGNLLTFALNWNPTAPFYTSNGLYNLSSNSVANPLAVIDGFNDVADVNVFLGNVSAGYKITNDLEYKFLYAINHGSGTRNSSIDGWLAELQGITGSGAAAISQAKLTSQTYTHTLNYNSRLRSNIMLNAVAGYEYWKSDYQNSTLGGVGFNTNLDQANRIPVLYTRFLQNATSQSPLVTTVDPTTEIQSIFGRVNLSLSEKYIVTLTVRADGSNKFGKNNRYGYFPSVGGKWLISSEDFMKGSRTLSTLGLRASWGITGNQEFPAGASLEQFTSGGYNSIGQSNVANPDLRWEKTSAYNVGLDYGILNNRITGSIDYYRKNTTDLLFQSTAIQPAPASIFFINLPANLINSGVEFSVAATLQSRKQFGWDVGFNIAYNKNLLKNFAQAPIQTGQVSGNGVSGALAQIIANNYPVNEYYLKEFRGFDQAGQQIVSDNPIYAGDPNPQFIAGISNTIRYDKLTFTVNASGAFGYLIYNNTFNTITNISQIAKGQNIASGNLQSVESIKSGVAASTRYLESGNFVKLRNASVSYAFGDVGRFVKNLNAFVSGTNLFVITKFTGFDPEVNVDKSNNNYPSRNMEYVPYPTPRTISFGFNLGF